MSNHDETIFGFGIILVAVLLAVILFGSMVP